MQSHLTRLRLHGLCDSIEPHRCGVQIFFLLRHTYIVCKLFHCCTVSSLSVNSYAKSSPPPRSPNLFRFCVWPTNVPKEPRWTLFFPPFYLPACLFCHDPWRVVNFHTYGTCQLVRMRWSEIIKALELRGITTQASTFLHELVTFDTAVVRSVSPQLFMVILQEPRVTYDWTRNTVDCWQRKP